MKTCVFLLLSSLVSSFAFAANNKAQLTLGSVNLPNGVTLEYAEKDDGNLSNGDRTVIFIHGWLDSWFSWSQVMELMKSSKYHMYAPSMRGHGLSSEPADGYNMIDYAADIIAFMDHFDIDKADFVGHSMGSIIAQRLALDYPDRTNAIILVGSGANNDENEVLLSIVDLVNALTDPVDQDFIREFVESLFVDQGFDTMFVDRLVREEVLVPANTWQKGLAGLLAADHLAELPQIAAPTLTIWGTEDQIFFYQDQLDLINGIPDNQLLIWENVGHAMQWEDPQRMADDVDNFLRGTP